MSGSKSTSKTNLLRQFDGPLTEKLVREPSRFGLGQVPVQLNPHSTTSLVCGYCSTGCSLKAHLQDGVAVNLSTDSGYPVNLGMACPKGWEALTPLDAPDRATTPYIRNRDGKLVSTDWDTALQTFVDRFQGIQQEHGKESVAFISTGQIVTEEMAFLGALSKFGMGILHGDGNTRQCMATSVAAYKQSFGFDAPPYTYKDFEESDVLVFVGANPCIAHPIMWQRVMRNKRDPEIVVIDPRKTETAMAATHHYGLVPKSDLVLFYGLAHALIERGAIDQRFIQAHTNEFEGFKAFVRDFHLDRIVQQTGLSKDQLNELVDLIASGKRVSFWWTMGVNQSHEGTRLAQAIINLALMTGNIGRPGTGANSITGQCNAMGSRLFSNTTNLLGGHAFENPVHREKVAHILGIDETRIPDRPSWAYDQIVEGIESGAIKGLWVIATNSAHSWINQNRFRKLVDKLEFLVVQDMYHSTDTARVADLILPAAGWGEKDGTFINSERRIGLVKKVKRAPGKALSDFNIFKLIAHYWGCGDLFKKWSSPEAVFQLLKQLTRGQPCDITGIAGYGMLEGMGGAQWPYPEDTYAYSNERRLFGSGKFYHDDGRARFIYSEPTELPEETDEAYPYILLTGRGSSSQWHTQTRTEKSDVLRKLYPQKCYVEINVEDARAQGIAPNQRVRVSSRRGEVEATAFVVNTVNPGQVFMPMHYAKTNQLTHASFDPHSRQPSYKYAAIRLTPISETL